jgi:hypothetical protein
MTVVLYGRKTLSLLFREYCRLMVFKNYVLRKAFGSKKKEVTGFVSIMRSFMNYAVHPTLFGWSNGER